MPYRFNPFTGNLDYYQPSGTTTAEGYGTGTYGSAHYGGSTGGGGGTTIAYVVVDTEPVETPDGVITTFTTPDTYYPNSLSVYINGVYEANKTEGATYDDFTLDYAPLSTDTINITYSVEI